MTPLDRMRKAATEAGALYDRSQYRDAEKQRTVAAEWALVSIAESLSTLAEPAAEHHWSITDGGSKAHGH